MSVRELGKHNPRWKGWLELARPGRRGADEFLVEGPKLVAEAARGRHPLVAILFDPARWQPDASLLQVCWSVTPEMLQRLSQAETSQGVVAIARPRPAVSLAECRSLLVCEGVADPGNLGSLLRTAWAAGVDGAAVLGGTDLFHPRVVRGSAGALFHLPVASVADLAALGPRAWIGLTPHTDQDLWSLQWPERWGLLVGNEARGLSESLLARVDRPCRISMQPGCESLNVAASAAVALFEWRRQAQR